MAEPSSPAAPSTPAPGPRDFLAKAESAISDLHSGSPDEQTETDEGLELAEGTDAPEETEDDGDGEIIEGSEAAPYNIKNLPDAYVTIKVDGVEQTVPIREMVDGYMRESAFHKRVNDVNELKRQAESIITKVQEERTRIQSSLRELLSTPEDMYSFLEDHAAETLDKIARRRLQVMMEWQKNPQAKYEYDRQRHEAKLRKEQKKFQDEREEYTRSRTETEATERYRKAFEPGWKEGMKEAGYPQVTDEFRVTLRGLLAARREVTGKDLTSDDIKQAVIRAARVTKAETVAERKPAAPAKRPQALAPKPKQAASQASAPKSYRDVWRNLGK